MMMTDNKQHDTIRVRDLVTGYKNRSAITRVSELSDATLSGGELTCLLGPNGAGKSTLLRTLAAFQPAIGGRIEIGGRSVAEYSRSELSRLIGVVLTERVSLDNMTVDELVGLGRSPYTGFWGRLSAHDSEIVDHAVRLVGIEQLRSRHVHTLSDGERQKVMIAKALAQDCPIVVLDEPTAFLDVTARIKTMELLRRISRDGERAILVSTHDLDLALRMSDNLWIMSPKMGVIQGPVAEVVERNGLEYILGDDNAKYSDYLKI